MSKSKKKKGLKNIKAKIKRIPVKRVPNPDQMTEGTDNPDPTL